MKTIRHRLLQAAVRRPRAAAPRLRRLFPSSQSGDLALF
jgi:hypothetical protein